MNAQAETQPGSQAAIQFLSHDTWERRARNLRTLHTEQAKHPKELNHQKTFAYLIPITPSRTYSVK